MRSRRELVGGLLLLAALATSLARTMRGPNDWAEAHWLLDYRFGFVKRGLPGQILTWATDLVGVPITEAVVAGVSYTMLAVFVATMGAMAFGICRRAHWSTASVAVMVAFLSSPFLVWIGHLNGYFDHVFFVLAVLSIRFALRGRLVAGALVQVVALLVHESCILLTYPAFALACLVRPGAGEHERVPRLLLPLLLPVLMAGVMAFVLSTPPPGFEAGFIERLRAAGFVTGGYEENTPKMLTLPLDTMRQLVWHEFHTLIDRHLLSFLAVLPNLVVLALGVWRHPALGRRALPALLAAAAFLLPLSMHAVAWDVERLWTYPIFTAFLVVWTLHAVRPDGAWPPRWTIAVAVVAIVVNLLVTTPLLDHAVDRMALPHRCLPMVVLLSGLGACIRAPLDPTDLSE